MLGIFVLGAVLTGCGATREPQSPSSSTAGVQRYLNDGDHDHPGDSENDNSRDTDEDPSQDYKPDENGLYHERDDSAIAAYGIPASLADKTAITSLVKRYFAAAVSDDGHRACALLVPPLARALPSQYSHDAGPSYLRGATTCSGLLSRLFQHTQAQMTKTFVVTGVRVNDSQAFALLGSPTAPASYISLQLERGRWYVSEPVATPLP